MRKYGMVAVAACAACTSGLVKIHTLPMQPNEQVLGEAEGSASGVMLFQLLPLGQNTKLERAQAEAMAKFPNANRLVDLTMEESWFWFYFGSCYSVSITGTAVGAKPIEEKPVEEEPAKKPKCSAPSSADCSSASPISLPSISTRCSLIPPSLARR